MKCCARKNDHARHMEGCPKSVRRKDFFKRKPGTKINDTVPLTCLDCRGYALAPDETRIKYAKCPRCGGGRMIRTAPKEIRPYVD